MVNKKSVKKRGDIQDKKIAKIETSSKVSQKKKSKKNLKKVVKKKIEIKDKKTSDDKKPKIDVEFDDGEAEVKIRTPGKEIKFHLKTTDEKKVLLEISKRTKIDINKLSKIVRFEQDD